MRRFVADNKRRRSLGVLALAAGAGALGVTALVVVTLRTTAVTPVDSSGESSGDSSGVLAPNAQLAYVIDGDTIAARVNGHDVRVRLDGIDTPEKTGGYLPAECYGDEASEYVRALLPPGTELRLERSDPPTDVYGRLLALVYRAKDGLLINRHLVELGYADAVNYGGNNPHYSAFVGVALEARERELGLWGACGGTDKRL